MKNRYLIIAFLLFQIRLLSQSDENMFSYIPEELKVYKIYATIDEALASPKEVFILDLSIKRPSNFLSREIKNLVNLKLLNLNGYWIKKLPDEIKELSNLEYLILSQCSKLNFNDAFKKIKQLPKLKHLNVWYNNFKSIPNSICELTQLNYLDLSFTGISKLPKDFKKLQNLTTLGLSANHNIKKFPEQILALGNLEHLNMAGSGITEIPKEIVQLEKLKKLDISGVSIKDISATLNILSKMKNLQVLKLENTEYTPAQKAEIKERLPNCEIKW